MERISGNQPESGNHLLNHISRQDIDVSTARITFPHSKEIEPQGIWNGANA
jgi:hypothetical protein